MSIRAGTGGVPLKCTQTLQSKEKQGGMTWHSASLVQQLYVTFVTVAATPLRFSGHWKYDAQLALKRTQDKWLVWFFFPVIVPAATMVLSW